MRIAVIIPFALFVNLSLASDAQGISLSEKNSPLLSVMEKIKEQSGYSFFYVKDYLKKANPVNVHLKNVPLTDALNVIFAGQPLNYAIENGVIVIREKGLIAESNSPPPPPVVIRGRITDSTGNPVAGASVIIKGTRIGTSTKEDGTFSLESPSASGTLVISSIGYAAKQVEFSSGADVNIKLESIEKMQAEIVVRVNIGYGTLDKREISSAISHVSAKELLTGANNDPLMSLQGKVSGLTVGNTSAADPNSTSTLQLRGVSSFKAGLTPLYVINGVPGGNIDNINQNDIASIDVLKGGAASAIYGTRGSNGVILITTKTGSAKPSTLYDVYGNFNFPTDRLKVLSREQYLTDIKGAQDFGANTNWLKEVTRQPSFTHKHTLQFSGGSTRNNYIASIDYRNANGLDLRSAKEEYGGRLNLSHTSGNDLFSVSLNIAPRVARTNTNGGGFDAALVLNPTLPVYDSVGNYKYFNGAFGFSNPVESARLIQSQQEIKELDGNASFRLNILKNLNTVLTIGQVNWSMKTLNFTPSNLSTVLIANGGNGRNTASQKQEENTQRSLEWVGNYSFDIKRHAVKLLGGYSYQYFNYQEFDANNQQFPFDGFTWNNLGSGLFDQQQGVVGMGSDQNSSKLIAFFGRLIYGFDNKYFITASLRHEGSTRFGPRNKWGNFPAVSGAWLLSEEAFMHGVSGWVDQLKVRADYGVTGNQDFPNYQSLLTYGGYGYYQYNGQYYQVFGPSQNVNPYLHWEKGLNFNAGLDFSLWKNRLSGSFNYYIRTNKDLLGNYPAPVPPNLQTSTYVNVGSMKNSGLEIQLNAGIVRSGDFTYNVVFNGNTNNNKFISFSNQLYRGTPYNNGPGMPAPGSPGYLQRLQEGVRVGGYYTFHSAGVDNTGGLLVYSKDGKVISANQASDNDRQFVGNGLPRFMASLGNNFRYKNWDLSIFLRGSFGYKIFNTYAFYLGTPAQQNGAANLLTSAFDKGSKYSKLTNPATVAILSDYFLEPGGFVKIDNVSLGYTQQFRSGYYIKSVRLYATGRNLHTFTKYTGGDPDQVPVTGLWPGVNYSIGYYPAALQLLFGLQVYF